MARIVPRRTPNLNGAASQLTSHLRGHMYKEYIRSQGWHKGGPWCKQNTFFTLAYIDIRSWK